MAYIKSNHQGYTFDPDYEQIFENKFTQNVSVDSIRKMRNDNVITKMDTDIAKFLFTNRFATSEMIARYFGIEDIAELEKRLEKLLKSKILNKFTLSNDVLATEIPADAYMIYCLDVGGRYLLTYYSKLDTTNWYTSKNMMGSEVISKVLITTNFYIGLHTALGDRLSHFKLAPEFRIGKMRVVASFELGVKTEKGIQHFIGDVVRDYDYPVNFREQISRLDSILSTQAWKNYFHDLEKVPPLLLFAENDDNALDVAKMVAGTTKIESFRVTTDLKFSKNVSSFYKYNNETQQNENKGIKSFT